MRTLVLIWARLLEMPELINPETPGSANMGAGFDNEAYELIFSDEINTDGRTFYPGYDLYWEAMDLWYGTTGDIEYYGPEQVNTKDGKPSILMENAET